MKKIYGIHFVGVWVDQATRIVVDDEPYCPAKDVDGEMIPAEYVVCSGVPRVMPLFFKHFDWARKKYDQGQTLIFLCEPTIIEYSMEQVLSRPAMRDAMCESCMGQYYGWDADNLASELGKAVNGVKRYEELF